MSLYDNILEGVDRNRQRRLDGKVNCIPWGFPRMEVYSPGVEQRHYYAVTGGSKEGKTQLTDQLFLYGPYEYMKANPDKEIKLKGIYFSLEMSKETKGVQAICRKLWQDSEGRNRQQLKTILSKVNEENGIIDDETHALIHSEKYKDHFNDFFETWTFVNDIKHAFKVKEFVEAFMKDRGKWIYKKVAWSDKPIRDYWQPKDPDEYIIIIVDHASLVHPTKEENKTGRGTWNAMKNLSQGLMELRDEYGITPVLVHQQSLEKKSNDSHKLGRLRPSTDGLGMNKNLIQDYNTLFGVFSPYHAEQKFYPTKDDYRIADWEDHIRFAEIIAGREGGAGNLFPLFFDGAVNVFTEMPKADDYSGLNELRKYIKYHKLLD